MNVQFCEACGKEASADARFCGVCGRPFPGADEPGPASGPLTEDELPRGDDEPESTLLDARPLAVQGFGELLLCLLTVGIVWLVLWLRRIQVRYVVTSQRIEIRRGIFNRRRETVELFRVQDFELQEPLFLRLRGAGNVVIRTMEREEPEFTLAALPGAPDVYETLRRHTLEERRRHRVRSLEGL